MFELEYIECEATKEKRLYYRQHELCVDASGSFCPGGKWSNWKVVPTCTMDEAKFNLPEA